MQDDGRGSCWCRGLPCGHLPVDGTDLLGQWALLFVADVEGCDCSGAGVHLATMYFPMLWADGGVRVLVEPALQAA